MTNQEKGLLLAYLVDASELDPEGDMEAQLEDWYQVREATVSGETHYKAILDAARIRVRIFEEGRLAGFSEAAAKLGWDEMATTPGLHRFMDHVCGMENRPPVPPAQIPVAAPDRGRSPRFMPRRYAKSPSGQKMPGLGDSGGRGGGA